MHRIKSLIGWKAISVPRSFMNLTRRFMNLNRTSVFLSCLILTITLSTLFCFCGRSQDRVQVAQSMNEAQKLAAKRDTWIVVDFWRHG
jgi:hypothetical protein